MKNYCTFLTALAAAALACGCAHSPDLPRVDRSFKYQPTDFEQQVGLPSCKVSVPLTREEALRVAELGGAGNLHERSDWLEMIGMMETGDQLRYVWCIPKGRGGVVFFALYRAGTVIAKMHTVILD